jgi:hypothetical protein
MYGIQLRLYKLVIKAVVRLGNELTDFRISFNFHLKFYEIILDEHGECTQ